MYKQGVEVIIPTGTILPSYFITSFALDLHLRLMQMEFIRVAIFVSLLLASVDFVQGANKNKPHGHNGALSHYDGKPINSKVTSDQNKKLEKGEPVTWNEKGVGKSGKGVVLQDIHASQAICMSKIRDLPLYPKMVPHCKKVDIYETTKFLNVRVSCFKQSYDYGMSSMSWSLRRSFSSY